jgi:lipopolysaccharide transport system ATP-binding protein
MSTPPSEIIHPSSGLDPEVLIKVDNVSKKFCRDFKKSLWYGLKDTAVDILHPSSSSQDTSLRPSEFWANQNISFEVKRGECVGLVGKNGAGKTTLLKMLNGLIKPDTGSIEMHGRVGALIALGAGFNPILTGRENIYVNGSILGLHKKEIDDKLEEIIDFAEIADAIDAPVRTYSSGMQVRLGFAVAVILIQPDVLLLDEVLAVGDAAFRVKCLNQVTNLLKTSAVIFVSHSETQIKRICTQAIVLSGGSMTLQTENISEAFLAYNESELAKMVPQEREWVTPLADVLSCSVSPKIEVDQRILSTDALMVHIRASAKVSLNNLQANLFARTSAGELVVAYEANLDSGNIIEEGDDFEIEYQVEALNLAAGRHDLMFIVVNIIDYQVVFKCENFLSIVVQTENIKSSSLIIPAQGRLLKMKN